MMHPQHTRLTQATRSSNSLAASTAPHCLEKYSERNDKNCLKRKRFSGCYSEIKKNGTREELVKKPKNIDLKKSIDCFAKHDQCKVC